MEPMINPFEKIGNFLKSAANKYKEKKASRPGDPYSEKTAPERKEARELKNNSELHLALLKAKRALQLVDLAKLTRGGMTRKDIRAMLRRFRAYGVRYLLQNRSGTFAMNNGAKYLVTRRGKFLAI